MDLAPYEDLMVLARELRSSDQRGMGRVERLELGSDTIMHLQRMEELADSIKSFDLQVIPALLQTPPYSLGVIKGTDPRVTSTEAKRRMLLKYDRIESYVERLRKTNAKHPDASFVIGELAITRPWSREAHTGQLRHLLDVIERYPNLLRVHVLPMGVVPPTTDAHFSLYMQETCREIQRVVYTETLVGGWVYTRPDDTVRTLGVFADLVSVSLSSSESARFIKEELKKWDPTFAGRLS